MKKLGIAAALVILSSRASAVDVWHSNTVWAGMGQCSASFTFDSGFDDITNLNVSLQAVGKDGIVVESGTLTIERFGQSSADRYAVAYLEGENICEPDLAIEVKGATAMIDGIRVDLLKSNRLQVRPFQPFKIRLGE